MAKRFPGAASEPIWRIVRIKGTPAIEIGTVTGPLDAEAAIAAAVEKFAITDPAQKERLAAYRIG